MPVHPRITALSPTHPSFARSYSSSQPSSSASTSSSAPGLASSIDTGSSTSMRPPPLPLPPHLAGQPDTHTQTIDAPFSAPSRPKSAGSYRHAPYPTTSVNFGAPSASSTTATGSGAGPTSPTGPAAGAGAGVRRRSSGAAAAGDRRGSMSNGLGSNASAGGAVSAGIGVGAGSGSTSPPPSSPSQHYHRSSSTQQQQSGMASGPAPAPAPAPYMVALSGWPEPVYIDSALFGARGRDTFDMGRGDGCDLAAFGSAGNGASGDSGGGSYGSPNSSSGTAGARSRFADPRFGAGVAVGRNRGALEVAPGWGSSASSGAAPSEVGKSSRGGGMLVMRAVPEVYPPPGASPAHALATSAQSQPVASAARSGTATSSSAAMSSSPRPDTTDAFTLRQQRSPTSSSTGTGDPSLANTSAEQTDGGSNGITKHPGMHAHPLARMSLPGMLGVATEVYPRDPDNGVLWRNVTSGLAAQRAEEKDKDKDKGKDKREEETDHVARSAAILSAPTPRAGDGWSPTVPWAATPMGAPGAKSAASTPRPTNTTNGDAGGGTVTPTKIRVKFKGDVEKLKGEEGGHGALRRSGRRVGTSGTSGEDEIMSGDEPSEESDKGKIRKRQEQEEPVVSVSRTREEDGEMDLDI